MLTVQEAIDAAFESKLVGYRKDEVEALRSRLVSTLVESGRGRVEGLAVGATELEEASFSRELWGYGRSSVDEFFALAAEYLAESGIVVGRGHRWITATELRQMRFRHQLDGYGPRAVRRVLELAAATLESHESAGQPSFTRRNLERIELPLRFVGYRCDEVETVLGRVASTLEFFESDESPTLDHSGWEDPEAL